MRYVISIIMKWKYTKRTDPQEKMGFIGMLSGIKTIGIFLHVNFFGKKKKTI